ncbi:hypothetical protein [Desulfovibrio sp. ZJ200]|uniref:hypothetical protein n=1 Tax=Desulfovibrio sp. ZJ200 TaxID=2709792 RepID=UPI00197F890B|nr:hypothetical protein [Desulfovibrio sp. ZJ200]
MPDVSGRSALEHFAFESIQFQKRRCHHFPASGTSPRKRDKRLKSVVFRLIASAVATKEATDEDSNWLLRQPANATAVAIRKARRLANGWRKQAKLANG